MYGSRSCSSYFISFSQKRITFSSRLSATFSSSAVSSAVSVIFAALTASSTWFSLVTPIIGSVPLAIAQATGICAGPTPYFYAIFENTGIFRRAVDQAVVVLDGRKLQKLIIYTVPFIGKNCAMPGALKRTPSSSLESVLAKHLISSDGTKSVLIGPELVTYLLSNCCQNDDEGSKSRVSMRFISTPAILSFNASQDLFFNDPLLVFIVLIVFHQL